MIPRRTPRLVASAAFALAGVTGMMLVAAAPALAIGERGDPGGRLSWVQTVLIFIGIPVAAAASITFLVFLPSLIKGPRYRPGRPWTAGSVWFGGPTESTGAAATNAAATNPAADPVAASGGGGASARW